jgi:GTP:adenosylcobinamide-phosphate guanylyltransferase
MTDTISRQLDVIVTAGDRAASRPVLHESKVFLPVAGIPAINHVLSAVERTRCVARIFVVGDKNRLEAALAVANNPFQGRCPVVLLEQGETLYDNVWNAFLHTLPGYTADMEWQRDAEANFADKAVLVMPGDIPLATPFEIDEFVDACDLSRYDYFLGLTAASTLRYYYPRPRHSGVRMAYFTLREVQARHNNLHLVKPWRLENRHYIQKLYDLRYQKQWCNIAKLCWEIATTQETSLRLVWAFVCLHIARLIAYCGLPHLRLLRPFFLELPMAASLMSHLLRSRFTTVMTHYGGCAIDIDNAEHYDAICANFARWQAHQYTLARELKQQA